MELAVVTRHFFDSLEVWKPRLVDFGYLVPDDGFTHAASARIV